MVKAESRSERNLGNRRAHRRATLTAPVLIDSARAHHTGHCRDVSEGGLSIELQGELAVGAAVDLYFELPTGVAIEAHAEVARNSGHVFGLCFRELSVEGRRAVAAYCDTWRAALLNKCARRVASIPNLRILPSGLSVAPDAGRASAALGGVEETSGFRIRAAEAWNDSGPSKSD